MGSFDWKQQLRRWWWAILLTVAAVVGLGIGFVPELLATNGAVGSFWRLISAVNRGDLDAVRNECSGRYLATHKIEAAPEGGVVNFPRNINKNFKAWRDGKDVLLCPTNRIGPVYRFVREGSAWKFDGPAGLLRPGGVFISAGELGAPIGEPGGSP